MTKISIAMACRNGAKYLEQQLSSIHQQTFLPDEIIISDDKSDDSTLIIANEWKQKSSIPIYIFENPKKLGITKNFEKAISECHGDIIFLCDQDDFWLSQKIEITINAFKNNPSVNLFYSNGFICDESLNVSKNTLWDALWFTNKERSLAEKGESFTFLLKHNVTSGNTLAFRRQLLSYLMPFPSLHSVHDAWVGLMASFVGSPNIIPEPLIKYRIHGNNQIGIKKRSLWEQFVFARSKMSHKYFYEQLALFKELKARLPVELCNNNKTRLLQKKITHLSNRVLIERSKFNKWVIIARECLNLNYFKYSYGIKSIMQDMFFRHG